MYKITANIVCKNEQYWIRESILSIVNLVDEIIYVDDNSTDKSLEYVKQLAIEHSNIKIFTHEDHKLKDLGDLKNFALSQSKNEFVIRWDADFIAYDDIYNLFEFCINHSERYDAYVLKGPNLSGDIYHQPKDKDYFGPECYLFRKSKMKFINNGKYPDYPIFENNTSYCYPEKSNLNKNFFFIHTNNLKSIERITFRKRMVDFHHSSFDGDYWQWIYQNSGNRYKMDISEFKKMELKKTINTPIEVVDFDYDKWGKHPSLLLNSKSSELFKIEKNLDKFTRRDYPLS